MKQNMQAPVPVKAIGFSGCRISYPAASRLQRGFTLIELLVVISIIALLAAILFPVFSRARENARRSNCQSNLKQIGLGMLQYTADYDERVPAHSNIMMGYPTPDGTVGWHEGLWFMVTHPYVKNTQLFNCPSEIVSAGAPAYRGQFMRGIPYGYNHRPRTFAMGTTYGITTPCTTNCGVDLSAFSSNPVNHFIGVRISAVENAAGTLWVVDTTNKGVSTTSSYIATPGDPEDPDTYAQYVSDRHLETVNCLFMDGHVKTMKKSAIVGSGDQYKYWTTSSD